jgi:hypothetical protein
VSASSIRFRALIEYGWGAGVRGEVDGDGEDALLRGLVAHLVACRGV